MVIIGDSAEPKSIEELFRDGWRSIKPAKKGKDSIANSIDILRRYRINYLAGDVIGKEVATYKFRTDKNGELQPDPVDFNNHAIDALRYYAMNELQISNKGLYSFR